MKLKSFCTSAAFILTELILVAAATTVAMGQTYTTLHSFDGTDGLQPSGGLVQATDRNLYGITLGGGTQAECNGGCGTVFRITTRGTLTTVHNFDGTDGASPVGTLVQAMSGSLYGATDMGGANDACSPFINCGTIFKITPRGTLASLYSFCSEGNCTDGGTPAAGLVQATDGNFYGTTSRGGANNQGGTVFKTTPSGTLTTLYSFCSQSNCTDGDLPYAGLLQATDADLYGTTVEGGTSGDGTVFRITPSGTLITLHSFNGSDGRSPWAELVQGTDGNFYGTTQFGGANYGTVFKITPSGTLTPLHNFGYTDGDYPAAGLVLGSDGNFYGTTTSGGATNFGTIFEISPSGTLTTLYSFCPHGCRDGSYVASSLVQATDGNFYGTTVSGGAHAYGTVFRLSVGLGPFVSFQRYTGKVGETHGILGQGFTGTTAVSFNGTAATFTIVSDTYLTATIPEGATSGFVMVTTPSGTLKSNKKFMIRP